MSPFAMLQRFFTGDFTRMFDELGGQRDPGRRADFGAWAPRLDVGQRGSEAH